MDDFRSVALSLPESIEQEHFGSASFRVRGKIFAQLSADEAVGLVKLPLHVQEAILSTYPEASWSEEHWGKHGWTRLRWRNLLVDDLKDLISRSWQAVAPRGIRSHHQGESG